MSKKRKKNYQTPQETAEAAEVELDEEFIDDVEEIDEKGGRKMSKKKVVTVIGIAAAAIAAGIGGFVFGSSRKRKYSDTEIGDDMTYENDSDETDASSSDSED